MKLSRYEIGLISDLINLAHDLQWAKNLDEFQDYWTNKQLKGLQKLADKIGIGDE